MLSYTEGVCYAAALLIETVDCRFAATWQSRR